VVIFSEGLCKMREKYLKKGAKVISRPVADPKWTDQSGSKKYRPKLAAAELQLDPDHARWPQRRRRRQFRVDESSGDFGFGGPSSAALSAPCR